MADAKIVWTDPAREDLNKIIAFLEEFWSPEMAIRFVNDFYDALDRIDQHPEIGTLSTNKLVRKVKIDKYNRLYYAPKTDALYLLRIIDTRSNPDDNPFTQ